MKSLLTKSLLTTVACCVLLPVSAATPAPDDLLAGIRADIDALRLSSPAGNNALEKIDAFRGQSPFDFRVVPLTYQWGEAYVALADKALAAREYDKARQYLDKVWLVASLTPGLEAAQDKLDQVYQGAPAVAARMEEEKAPDQAELKRQRQLAEAAEQEKARAEAEHRRKQEEAKRQAAAEKQQAEQERLRRQEEERRRRAEAEKAQQAAAAKRLAEAEKTAAKPAVKVAAVKPVTTKVVAVSPAANTGPDPDIAARWEEASEDSASLATYPVSSELLSNRDRDIVESLQPVCQAILDNDASVVVHTQDKADYRWLTVRLTLCLRRLDKTFRLRHSYAEITDDAPFVSLHPSRQVSLIRKVGD